MRQKGFLVPNVSGFYHAILRSWWEQYGLGERCLLVSETHAASRVFKEGWPLPADSEQAQAIRVLARAHQDAIWDRQQAANKLRSLLRR